MFEPPAEAVKARELLAQKVEEAIERATRSDQMVDSIDNWRKQVDKEAEAWRKHG